MMIADNMEKTASVEEPDFTSHKSNEHPSDRESRELIEKFRQGNQSAFDSLIERNQKLVISIARTYSKNQEFLNDLIQEGNLGLIRAIQKFNLKGKTQLSTYATIWIKSNIETYISKSTYSFKVPQSSRKIAFKAFKMYERLRESGVSEPEAVTSIAESLDITESAAARLVSLKNACINMQDRRGSDEGAQEIQDTIASSASVEKDLEGDRFKSRINTLVQRLPEKQRDAISLYYGLGVYPEKPAFSDVARHMGITREYARILFNNGMKSLKDHSSFGELAA